MTDESIVNLSDTTKATMRNYAMVAGFMVLFILGAIEAAAANQGIPSQVLGKENYLFLRVLAALSLIVIGSALAFLHKRDLVAMMFLLLAIILLISPIGSLLLDAPNLNAHYPAAIVSIIIAVAFLFTRNEQKYVCGLILLPYSILTIAYGISGNLGFCYASYVILAVVSVFCALTIGLENPKSRGYRLLTADEVDATQDGSPVHFKVSGAVLGYALIMIPAVCNICGYFDLIDIHGVGGTQVMACIFSCGLMLIFVGFLMLTAGRMKFTPFLFMMMGIAIVLLPIVNNGWLLFVFLLAIVLMCLLRSDRRILVGASVFILGLSYLFIPGGVYPCVEMDVVLSAILVVILSYVCFALCSDNRLKLI